MTCTFWTRRAWPQETESEAESGLWDAKIIGAKVLDGLKRRGIHLYTLYTEADTPPEEGSTKDERASFGAWRRTLGGLAQGRRTVEALLSQRDFATWRKLLVNSGELA